MQIATIPEAKISSLSIPLLHPQDTSSTSPPMPQFPLDSSSTGLSAILSILPVQATLQPQVQFQAYESVCFFSFRGLFHTGSLPKELIMKTLLTRNLSVSVL